MNNILEVKKLRKEYREFVLDNISFNLEKGYILGIIGPNGAGKTTTLKLIMNFISKNSGEINIFGEDNSKDEKKLKNRIGYVGEEQYYYEDKTVDWTAKFVSAFYSQWNENLFNSYLNEFNISRSKKIKELSKGMRVKLSLAIALSHNAELIILDEPTSGLDPVIRREVLDILQKVIEDETKSVIISSHITDDISRIADYILYMVNGKIVLMDEKDTLLSNWKKIHFKPDTLSEQIVNKLKNINNGVFGGSGITSDFQNIKDVLESALEKGNVKVENLTLDDILISFVKGD